MGELNQLTIEHQDGAKTFQLTKGGYCIEGGRISISIETRNTDAEDFPAVALICIEDHPIDSDLQAGDTFECDGGMCAEDSDVPGATKASGYFEFHAEEVYVKWVVEGLQSDGVVFALKARHDDVDYYDERAEKCPTTGRFALESRPKAELWIPRSQPMQAGIVSWLMQQLSDRKP